MAAAIAQPDHSAKVLYDPAAGEGELLLECADTLSRHGHGVQVFGQELQPATWRIARTRLLIAGIPADLGEPGHDSIHDDRRPDLRADLVVVDPPISAPLRAWVLHATGHLAHDGRAAIALPASAIVPVAAARRRPDDGLRDLLTEYAEAARVDSVVVLTRGVRPDVAGPLTIWVLRATPDPHTEPLLVAPPATKRSTRTAALDVEAMAQAFTDPERDSSTGLRTGVVAGRVEGRQLLRHLAQSVGAVETNRGRQPSTTTAEAPDTGLRPAATSMAAPHDGMSDDTSHLTRENDRLHRELEQQRHSARDLADLLDDTLNGLWHDDPTLYFRIRGILDSLQGSS
jgi:hypothetical protein